MLCTFPALLILCTRIVVMRWHMVTNECYGGGGNQTEDPITSRWPCLPTGWQRPHMVPVQNSARGRVMVFQVLIVVIVVYHQYNWQDFTFWSKHGVDYYKSNFCLIVTALSLIFPWFLRWDIVQLKAYKVCRWLAPTSTASGISHVKEPVLAADVTSCDFCLPFAAVCLDLC